MKTILTTIALLLSFELMAYDMTCKNVLSDAEKLLYIERCENKEITCYVYSRNGMQCEFKRKNTIKQSKTCLMLRESINIKGMYTEEEKRFIKKACEIKQ